MGDAKIVCLWRPPGLSCVSWESGSELAALVIHTVLSAVSTLVTWQHRLHVCPTSREVCHHPQKDAQDPHP